MVVVPLTLRLSKSEGQGWFRRSSHKRPRNRFTEVAVSNARGVRVWIYELMMKPSSRARLSRPPEGFEGAALFRGRDR